MKSPTIEGFKEVARWAALFAVSWLVAETLKQATLIPEMLNVKVWVFSYHIPVRELSTLLLTFCGRFVDKWIFEHQKVRHWTVGDLDKPKGLLPW